MKLLTSKKLLASCGVAAAMFFGCGDDTSSNFVDEGSTVLPDTVESFVDLSGNSCGAANKCKGVYTMDMGYGVCDGKGGWVYGSLIHDMDCGIDYVPGYDEPPVSSSIETDNGVSSSSMTGLLNSSAVVESSSSSGPKYEIKETCTAVDPCEGMDRTDVSTWHFTRKDAFGDPAEYTYKAEGDELHLTIVHADGQSNTQILTMYKMTTEVGKEMAFSAARSTCRDGNDGESGEQVCVSDTVLVAD